jgi:hypothetical protein
MNFTIEQVYFNNIFMPQFFQYSLESAICLAILLLPYLLWFRKTTFYQWNRFYLLGAIFFAFSAPLLNIEIKTDAAPQVAQLTNDFQIFKEVPEAARPLMGTKENVLLEERITAYEQAHVDAAPPKEKAKTWDLAEWILLFYASGAMVFGGMFLYRLVKLFRLIAHGDKEKGRGFTFIHLPGKQVFSFFHFVFFDHDRYHEKEKQTLLKHEQVHIHQWHSVDVLALEVLQVVFWFDPLYRIYKKLLQQEHEYFVDAAISKEIGQPQYAKMLLTLATTKQPLLGHAFAYIPVKHRIFKLLQKPSTTMEKSKFLFVLPFTLVLFFVFSCSVEELDGIQINEQVISGQVRKVNAFFINEYRGLKNEQLMMEVEFNDKGAIVKDADNHNSLIWENRLPKRGFPAYLPYYTNEGFKYTNHNVHSNYIDGIARDFYPKNIQHLIIQDPDFSKTELLLFYKNISDLVALDKDYLSDMAGFQYFNSGIDSDIFTTYFAKRDEDYGSSIVDVKIEYGENNLPVHWEKERRFRPNMGALNASKMSRHEELAYTAKSFRYFFDMRYNEQNLLSKLTYSSLTIFESFPGGAQRDSGRNVKEMHLSYNLAGQIHEMEIYNAEQIFLRKYRFYYNEAGYCTKKECINREGSVEFSVRFVYEFYGV